MTKKLFSNLLVSLISIVLILAVAEVVMRFAWQMGGWVKRPIYRKSSNPYLRYELVAGANEERIRINSGGFRGPEYSFKKPAGTFRILMLGDSETFSYLLEEKDSLASQLETLLNKKPSDKRYEVLNFGVEGYCTLQELEQLKVKGLKYEPDLIILNYCMNDPEPGEYYFSDTFLMRHSALVRYFSFSFKKAYIKKERKRKNINTEIDNYYYYYQPKYFLPAKNAILEMASIAQTRGGKLVVVIFPVSSLMVKNFKDDYPYKPMHQIIASIPSKSIVFIELIDEFNRLGLTPEQVAINYKYDESHKNPASLKVSALYIRDRLVSEGLLPKNSVETVPDRKQK